MYKVIVTTLLVLLANVGGWGACVPFRQIYGSGQNQTSCNRLYTQYATSDNLHCSGPQLYDKNGYAQCHFLETGAPQDCGYIYNGCIVYYDCVKCDTKCEVDSLAGCPVDYVWNSDSCKCVPKPPTESDSTFTICTEEYYNGSPQASIYGVTCHYENGVAVRCCGVSPSQITGTGYQTNCPLLRRVSGTCNDNGVPNGPSDPQSAPNENQVPFLPTSRCYATIGSTCYMSDYRSGNTFSCECDGSCQHALDLQVHGQGCRNPYPQTDSSPSSSDSGGDTPGSSDSGNSSDSGSSSGSGGGSDKDYTDQLNQIIANTQGIMNNTGDISQWTQTTMDNTTDIKNEVSNLSIDVSHINTNTANTANNTYTTAENTGAINNKLSTTNQLLEDIKNKNWQPNINVAGDTNIVNVAVGGDTIIVNVGGDSLNINVDTTKAPAEILGFLRGVFGDTTNNFNPDDTAGSGAQIEGVLNKIDSLVGEGIPVMNGDSVGNAMNSLKTNGLGAIKDTINGSAISDSMTAWGLKITDNGYITGQGSDNCPEILTRTWQVRFPIGTGGVDVDIGPLGVYLCRPVAGMGITFWALCRVILRAMVAIACMIWLYKSVLGIDGGSNEED